MIFVAALLAAASAPMTFKNATIGMSLEEWRKLTAPANEAGTFGQCNTDPNARSFDFFIYSREKSVGIVECRYFYRRNVLKMGKKTILHQEYAPLPIGEYVSRDIAYRFYEGRLYEITGTVGITAERSIRTSLTNSYGDPVKSDNYVMQNGLGVHFNQNRSMWSSGTHSAKIISPYDGRQNTLQFGYVDIDARLRISKILEAQPTENVM